MATGQNLSRTQQGIVKRYYDNADTITMTKLQELVTEIYLATGKKADTLWKRAADHLAKTDAKPDRIRTIVDTRDVEALAALVTTAKVKTK